MQEIKHLNIAVKDNATNHKGKMKDKKSKLNNFIIVISILIFMLAIYILSVSLSAKAKGNLPNIFGYSLHIVVSDSMSPMIDVGDLVITKKEDFNKIKIDDIIVFKSIDPLLAGKVILHKVVDITEINGQKSLITQGVKEGAPIDSYPVTQILGKYKTHSVLLGNIVQFLSKPLNWLFLITLIVLFKIIVSLIKKIINIQREMK